VSPANTSGRRKEEEAFFFFFWERGGGEGRHRLRSGSFRQHLLEAWEKRTKRGEEKGVAAQRNFVQPERRKRGIRMVKRVGTRPRSSTRFNGKKERTGERLFADSILLPRGKRGGEREKKLKFGDGWDSRFYVSTVPGREGAKEEKRKSQSYHLVSRVRGGGLKLTLKTGKQLVPRFGEPSKGKSTKKGKREGEAEGDSSSLKSSQRGVWGRGGVKLGGLLSRRGRAAPL